MPFKIVRNDIVNMDCDAIVNTASTDMSIGSGCNYAVHQAAGEQELLSYRQRNIGKKREGDVFITPGFNLKCRYIIHAVSPFYMDGNSHEEDKLRMCYRRSLELAFDNGISSIAFPLISTGSYGYPKEEGMRIAIDEINRFMLSRERLVMDEAAEPKVKRYSLDDMRFKSRMMIYLVVFDTKSTELGENIYPDLEAYIDHNYVCDKREEEYGDRYFGSIAPRSSGYESYVERRNQMEDRLSRAVRGRIGNKRSNINQTSEGYEEERFERGDEERPKRIEEEKPERIRTVGALPEDKDIEFEEHEFSEQHSSKLNERMAHMTDTFSEYLLYLIEDRGMTNAEVYKRAIVDKKVFSKIKNSSGYHPNKMTAMCLCVGAKLNMDETKDLLARAGYALSPCDKTDVIFSYFIENKIYDMIELDIQLEERGLKCLIS